ncbi:hypothetical protein ACU4GD_25645 [Cupriavidus basilensis]
MTARCAGDCPEQARAAQHRAIGRLPAAMANRPAATCLVLGGVYAGLVFVPSLIAGSLVDISTLVLHPCPKEEAPSAEAVRQLLLRADDWIKPLSCTRRLPCCSGLLPLLTARLAQRAAGQGAVLQLRPRAGATVARSRPTAQGKVPGGRSARWRCLFSSRRWRLALLGAEVRCCPSWSRPYSLPMLAHHVLPVLRHLPRLLQCGAGSKRRGRDAGRGRLERPGAAGAGPGVTLPRLHKRLRQVEQPRRSAGPALRASGPSSSPQLLAAGRPSWRGAAAFTADVRGPDARSDPAAGNFQLVSRQRGASRPPRPG